MGTKTCVRLIAGILNDINSLTDNGSSKSKHQDEGVYTQLFDAILSQTLLPGSKLTEEELSSIFKVSRTVIRRALLRLSHDQIVVIEPNKGASVAMPSSQQAREVLAARSLIETAVIKAAVHSIDANGLADLRQLVAAERIEFQNGRRGSGIRLSGDFHLALARATGNRTLTKFLNELIPLTSLIITRFEMPGCATCSHEEHLELINVIESGTETEAAAMMARHIQHINDKLDLRSHEASTDLQQVFSHIVNESN